MARRVQYPVDRSIVRDRYGKNWTKQNGSWKREDGKTGFRTPSGATPFNDISDVDEDDLYEPDTDAEQDVEDDAA